MYKRDRTCNKDAVDSYDSLHLLTCEITYDAMMNHQSNM